MGRGPASDTKWPRGAPTLTAFVDANVLVRHLTGDPPEMAGRATALLASGERLLLADLVLADCAYVLESFYEVPRGRVAELLRAAMALPTVDTVDPMSLLRALEVYEVDRVDFAEAYLVAQAEATGVATLDPVSVPIVSAWLYAVDGTVFAPGSEPGGRCREMSLPASCVDAGRDDPDPSILTRVR